MQYLMMIYGDEKGMAAMSQEEVKGVMERWFAYDGQLRGAVQVLGGSALQPTTTATTVQGRNGKAVTSDGPYAETKEQLGGFYWIDAKDLDEAIEWAGKMPNIPFGGSVEVRPIMVFDT